MVSTRRLLARWLSYRVSYICACAHCLETPSTPTQHLPSNQARPKLICRTTCSSSVRRAHSLGKRHPRAGQWCCHLNNSAMVRVLASLGWRRNSAYCQVVVVVVRSHRPRSRLLVVADQRIRQLSQQGQSCIHCALPSTLRRARQSRRQARATLLQYLNTPNLLGNRRLPVGWSFVCLLRPQA